jgi:hypothetical protein
MVYNAGLGVIKAHVHQTVLVSFTVDAVFQDLTIGNKLDVFPYSPFNKPDAGVKPVKNTA